MISFETQRWRTVRRAPAVVPLVLGLLLGCTSGEPAIERPEWLLALDRARAANLLDDSCISDGVTYQLVSDAEWRDRGWDMKVGGKTDSAGVVVVRENGVNGYSASFILEHEFLHAILDCGGKSYVRNAMHVGPAWNGLRDGDPKR